MFMVIFVATFLNLCRAKTHIKKSPKKTVNIYANISSTIVLWCGSIYLSTRPPGFDLCCPGRHGPFAASERSGCVVVGACMGIMISHHAWGIYGNMEGISVTGVCWWFIHTSNWHISLYNYSYTYIYIHMREREIVKTRKNIWMLLCILAHLFWCGTLHVVCMEWCPTQKGFVNVTKCFCTHQ